MSHVVYARTDTRVVWSGGMSPIALGEVWDSEAPLVKERPDLFSAEPTRVRGRVARPPVDTPETGSDQGKPPPDPSESGQVADKPARARKAAG